MITYKEIKEFTAEELKELFLSVNWPSGNYPDQLIIAMKNSDTVISAWDEDKLIGLINALSDGAMTAYFHYLLINPDYQSMGIGKSLVKKALTHYKSFKNRLVISLEPQIDFYEKCGFKAQRDKTPMFDTSLKI